MTVSHFGVWFAGAGGLVAGAAAVLGAWFAGSPAAFGPTGLAGWLAIPCIGLALHGVAGVRPTRVRWDGQCWFAAPAGAPTDDGAAVGLNVAIDLGGWMLLRLRPPGASRWSASTWLPAQRRGHEAHWHALRCAVYSPRPAPGDPSAAEP